MAAAFAALISLKNDLDLIQNHPTHSFSFEPKQIQSLEETVRSLIDLMKSHARSPGIRKEAAESLERQVARAAEAAEDVVESHVVDQIRSGEMGRSNTGSPRFLLDLQKVTVDLEYMRRKAMNVKAQNGTEATNAAAAAAASNKAAPATTTMVGFEEVHLQLLDKLTGVPLSRQVIPIVGMGGIGKTFLARNAYKDKLTEGHFDVRLWAAISQQYKVEKILAELVSGIRQFKSKNFGESTGYRIVDQAPDVELHKSLYGRRYLIVLDDMWSIEAWDAIQYLFPDTHNGSRIIITTRDSYVANHFNAEWRAMRFLNENNSWDLFCQKAFPEQVCPPELEETGKKIVEKCKGLPLAIVVAGGHLRKSSLSPEYWENIANHMDLVLNSTEKDEQCLNVLSLSYSYLPPHLKPCFLLLGAFPEDETMLGRDVRKLWITEGLVEPAENTVLEPVAEDYLQDLYERNLILVDGMGFDGKIGYFKIHDLLRELCIKIGEREDFLLALDSPGAINRERRVVISGKEVAEVKRHRTKTFHAPTRFMIHEGGWSSYDLKLLRTLNTVVPESTSVSIFQQFNLRFLKVNLEATSLRCFYLPSSISRLWNLQILAIDLDSNWSKVIAPYEIWEMLQLRHLEITSIYLLDPFRYRNEASSYYCPQNLCYFDELIFFIGIFDPNFEWRDFVLSLTFPRSLKWLFIFGCRVNWEEMTTIAGSLPNLLNLRLFAYSVIGSEWTTVEGKFPSLKCLEIWGCDELVSLNVESSHFPALQRLHLSDLPNLDELPSEIGEITTLEGIIIEHCSESSSMSAIRILVEQEELGNTDFWVRVSLKGDEETLKRFENQVQDEGLRRKNLFLDLQIVKP